MPPHVISHYHSIKSANLNNLEDQDKYLGKLYFKGIFIKQLQEKKHTVIEENKL